MGQVAMMHILLMLMVISMFQMVQRLGLMQVRLLVLRVSREFKA
jgi:hypothetical protein